MADGAQQRSRHFSAFISYNHNPRDAKFARRLHRELEGYRLPRSLARKAGGAVGPTHRLKPLFRDADEMTAAPDLSEAVLAALADSDFLIVVCSPEAARSFWVGREIEFFRDLHGDQHILAVLAEGSAAESFPPALLKGVHGALHPLAADFRPDGSGRRLAMLRLVGALAGVGLDELIHRDARRRMRTMVATGAAGMAATVAAGALVVMTVNAEQSAKLQRSKGVAVVASVLDLRSRLRGVASLDELSSVNKSALAYYRGQDISKLSEAALRERARLLQAMGEDDEKRGNLEAARIGLEEAHRTTAAILAKKANDPQRIFDHAQSEYWVGFINLRNGQAKAARKHFQAYATLADRLVESDPNNDAWLMETAYAASNLGMLALRQHGNAAEAKAQFLKSLRIREMAAQRKPGDAGVLIDVSNAMAWVADAERVQGDIAAARLTRASQRQLLTQLLQKHPNNAEAQADLLGNDLALARIEVAEHRWKGALARLAAGRKGALELAAHDAANKTFPRRARMFELFTIRTWLAMPPSQRPPVSQMEEALGSCAPKGSGASDQEIADFCTALHGRILALTGNLADAEVEFARVRQAHAHEVLSAQWGLNFLEETRAGVGLAQK